MGRSGREADQVRHNWNGEAEVALPNVDQPEPAVERAQVGMRGRMDFIQYFRWPGPWGGRYRHLMATWEAAAVLMVWPTVWPMVGCQRLTKGGLRAEGIGLG